jgi:hypothetical protein
MTKTVIKNRISDYMNAHHKRDRDVLKEVPVSRDTLYRLKKDEGFARIDATTVKAFMDFFGLPFDRLFYFENDD